MGKPEETQDVLPSYEEALESTPHFQDVPTNIDFSTIPEGTVLYPHQLTLPERSIAAFEIQDGIRTYDPLLDNDADEVWKFFMSHLQKPELYVRISGEHDEHRHRHGKDETDTVCDFDFQLDVTHFVNENWTRIACEPRSGHRQQTYREAIEEYVTSNNIFKEMRLKKQVVWNYEELSRVLEYCVRTTGYTHKVKITFPLGNSTVSVYSSNKVHKLSHNIWVRVLAVITCLWIFLLPWYLYVRKRIGNNLVADYVVTVTPSDFYGRNFYTIRNFVMNREKYRKIFKAL